MNAGGGDDAALIPRCVRHRARPQGCDAATAIDITRVAPVDIAFHLVGSVGLEQRDLEMIIVARPAGLSRITFVLVVGLRFINVPNGESALWQGTLESDRLTVLDQQILACGKTVRDLISDGNRFHSRQALETGRDDGWRHPAQFLLAPGAQVRWVSLCAIEAPRVGHQTIRANAFTGVVRIIQVGQSEIMPGFMCDDADASDLRAGCAPKRGLGVVIVHLHVDARAIEVGAGPTSARKRKKRPAMRPHPVTAAAARLRRVARVDDGQRVDETVVIGVELSEIHDGIRRSQCVLHHALGIGRIGSAEPAGAIGVISLGMRQRHPRNDRAVEGQDSVGRLFVVILHATGGRKRGIAAHRVEYCVVVRRRARLNAEGVIAKAAKDDQVFDRAGRRDASNRSGSDGGREGGRRKPVAFSIDERCRRSGILGETGHAGVVPSHDQCGGCESALGVWGCVNVLPSFRHDRVAFRIFVPMEKCIAARANRDDLSARLANLHWERAGVDGFSAFACAQQQQQSKQRGLPGKLWEPTEVFHIGVSGKGRGMTARPPGIVNLRLASLLITSRPIRRLQSAH